MSGASSSNNQMSLLEHVALAAHYLDSNIFVKESLQELVNLRDVPLEMYIQLEVKKYVAKYNTYESKVILERIVKLEASEWKRKNEEKKRCGKRPISSVSSLSSTSSCEGEPVNKKVATHSESARSPSHRTAPLKFEGKAKVATSQAKPSAPVAPKPLKELQKRLPDNEEKMQQKVRDRKEEKENRKKEGERRAAHAMEDFQRSREKRIKEAQERKKNGYN